MTSRITSNTKMFTILQGHDLKGFYDYNDLAEIVQSILLFFRINFSPLEKLDKHQPMKVCHKYKQNLQSSIFLKYSGQNLLNFIESKNKVQLFIPTFTNLKDNVKIFNACKTIFQILNLVFRFTNIKTSNLPDLQKCKANLIFILMTFNLSVNNNKT